MDITANFHGGNAESVAAHGGRADRVRRKAECAAILAYARTKGRTGVTADELAAALSMPYQSTSGRCAELKVKCELVPVDERRLTRAGRSARVMVHWVYATNAEYDALPARQKSRRRPEGVKDRPLLCPHCGVAWDE